MKSIEDMRQLLGADPFTRIADDELDGDVRPAQADVDATTARRELERVADDVRDDLMQPVAVTPDETARLDGGRCEQTRSTGILTRHGQYFVDHRREID